MMSSEEERQDENGDSFYYVRSLPWRSKKYNRMVSKIDEAYLQNMAAKAKKQYNKRVPVHSEDKNGGGSRCKLFKKKNQTTRAIFQKEVVN